MGVWDVWGEVEVSDSRLVGVRVGMKLVEGEQGRGAAKKSR